MFYYRTQYVRIATSIVARRERNRHIQQSRDMQTVWNSRESSNTHLWSKPANGPHTDTHTFRCYSSESQSMARITRAASATALVLSTLVRPMPAAAFLVRSPLTRAAPFSNHSRAVLQAGKGFGDTPKPKQPQEPAKDKAPRKVCSCALLLRFYVRGGRRVET